MGRSCLKFLSNGSQHYPHCSHTPSLQNQNQSKDQREWVFEVREVKSENKKLSLFFEKCKVKKNAFTLFREVQSEIKMLSLFFEKWKVKSKCFEIEIEKWKFSRILNNSRETRFLNRFIPWKPNQSAKTDGLLMG